MFDQRNFVIFDEQRCLQRVRIRCNGSEGDVPDPDVMAKTGQTLASWTLSREYGFEDIDGRRPDWGAYYERVVLGENG